MILPGVAVELYRGPRDEERGPRDMLYGVRCLDMLLRDLGLSSRSNDDDDDEDDEADVKLPESLSLSFVFFPLAFLFTTGDTSLLLFFLLLLLALSSLVIDLRDSLLLLLLSPDDSGILLNSENEDVVDGEEVGMCLEDEAPLPFLLVVGLAATGFFISFLFEVECVTTGWGEGTAAGDTDLEFVELSLSTIADEDVVAVSLVKEDEDDDDDAPGLDIKKWFYNVVKNNKNTNDGCFLFIWWVKWKRKKERENGEWRSSTRL